MRYIIELMCDGVPYRLDNDNNFIAYFGDSFKIFYYEEDASEFIDNNRQKILDVKESLGLSRVSVVISRVTLTQVDCLVL